MIRRALFPLLTALLTAGCGRQEPLPAPDPGGGATGTGTGTGGTWGGTPTGTPSGTPTGTTTTPCMSMPPIPASWTVLNNIPPSEEFAFDAAGNLYNIDDGVGLFYVTSYAGAPSVVAPYASAEVAGIRFRTTGDRLVLADEGAGALMELDLAGSPSVLLGSIPSPNSVAVHRDGWIYTTAQDEVWLVDPSGVNPAELQFTIPGTDLDGLVFTNDYQWLYLNHDEDGVIIRARVNADGTLGAPQVVTTLSTGAAELDGMAIDECDNLYVLVTDGRIYLVRPDGAHAQWLNLTGGAVWTTSLHFGSGYGGWQRDHLYVMNRWGGVYDIPVGLNGKPEPHY